MSEDIKVVKEIVKANLTEVYRDAAQPSVRIIGKTLAQCVSLFATPVGRTAEILERNLHKYLDKLEGVPEEQIISPDVRVLVPILERMRYTEDEVVANYYAEILATASKKDTKGKALLSFIEILNRVTADEIKILEFINSADNAISFDPSKLSEEERKQYNLSDEVTKIALGGAIPMIDVQIKNEETAGYRLALNNFNLLAEKIILDFPDNVDSYIDNLISLGLLHIPSGKSYAFRHVYTHLKEHPIVKNMESNLKSKEKMSFEDSRLDLTSLAYKLLAICTQGNSFVVKEN